MIPEAAVEAAAKAAYESTMEDGDTPWEHFGGSSYLDYYRAHARAALEAAAPLIAGQALRHASDEIEYGNPIGLWLCERANHLDGRDG